jgi:hypothetical protein
MVKKEFERKDMEKSYEHGYKRGKKETIEEVLAKLKEFERLHPHIQLMKGWKKLKEMR